ncbi:hypothetical protein F1880_009302 [Penicillium rolfsii]|nr:hypothetical protein F1880_009302 [Penicillium rolfsii]
MSERSQIFSRPSAVPVSPLALLWSYEFRRQNGILTSRLLDVKGQLNEREQLTELLSKFLNDLIVVIASMVTVLADQSDGAEHRIRLLHRLLGQTVEPLCRYAAQVDLGNQALIDCIAQLEVLYELPVFPLGTEGIDSSTSPSSALSATSDGPPQSLRPVHDGCNESMTESGHKDDQISPDEAREALALKLDAVMHQEGRPLEDYFDAACDFRRDQIRLGQSNDPVFIEAFLAGCDNNLYRRRLTHALRKNGWYWTWLTHEVQYLILEQE